MAKDSNILEKARAEGLATPAAGMKVPDGYFASFAGKMTAMLPERPELTQGQAIEAPRTMWERFRPYVYMAAMFAGIWLMLQIFVSFDHGKTLTPIDENPVLAEALAGDDFVFDYVYTDLDERDLVDDMLDSDKIDSSFEFGDIFDAGAESTEQTYILP